MDKNIQQILAELYELEPQLKQYEEQLIRTIQKLLAAKPDTRFDQQFVSQLRAQLIATNSVGHAANSFNFNFMKKFGYLLGGAVVASLLVVPVMLNKFGTQGVLDFNAEREITLVDEQAFGDLDNQLALAEGLGASEASRSATMEEQAAASNNLYAGDTAVVGMDSKISAVAPTSAARPQSGGGGSAGTSMIYDPNMPYVITQFNYNYTGEDFTLESEKLEVLRQIATRPSAGSLLSSLSLGLVNLSQVSGLKLENVSLSQGTSDGVRIYTDFINGEVYINQESGYMMPNGEYRPLTPSEVPSDADLIKVADAFIKRFGIKLDGYASPEVSQQNHYAIELYAREGADVAYIPDVFTVVYPLVVKDLPVYDQGGNKVGIMVSINVRTNQAVSISGLTLQKYEASLYPVNSDIGALLQKYQDQGRYAYEGNYTVENIDINLGTPELVFVAMFTYNNNQSQKLLVPAYRFPVFNKPADQYWFADNIIIPLVSGLDGVDGPRIMPMGEPLMMKTEPGVATPPSAAVSEPSAY